MSASPSFSPRPRDKTHPYASPRIQRSASSASKPTGITKPHSSAHSMPPPAFTVGVRTPHLVHHDARTPSPNYFGLAFDAPTDVFSSNEAKQVRPQWSPATSQVQSTAAASPRIIPVEANPEYAAFRKQSETSKFTLGRLHSFDGPAPISSVRPTLPTSPISPKRDLPLSPRPSSAFTNTISLDIPEKPRSPKRVHSEDAADFLDRPRRTSPASFTDSSVGSFQDAPFMSPDKSNRPSLPPTNKLHSSFLNTHQRADTLPTNIDDERDADGPILVSPQRIVNLLDSAQDEILVLDLRVSTQYSKARIAGALTLCIPTTLIKRPSFNVAKLAETFKDEESKKKFEAWKSSKYIIVYDADSSTLKDATICINTLKKFETEQWKGTSYIIRGGFSAFSKSFPNYIVGDSPTSSDSRNSSVSTDASGPLVAPVIGGCPMPATKNAANPFFGNIRQNMDLIGGVGQMSLKRPQQMTSQHASNIPAWLKHAIDERDDGKTVADKFLHIEKREQKRMQEALSANVTYGTPSPGAAQQVRIAGIEKGAKNRYNNIWPYEHSRVKLQGVSRDGCDYINASHVKADWTHKHYIATQGPIPATFNDFWNAIWQQDVRVIVMLTAEQEGGQIKAHNYWSGQQFGHIRLNFLSEHRASLELSKIHRRRERAHTLDRRSVSSTTGKMSDSSPTSDQPYVIVRKFTMSHSDYPFERMREVTQLQYSSWPDFGAPAHPAHLLGLVEQCDNVVRSTYGMSAGAPEPANSRPVVVHCSAGCGRTGTFCTVDAVLDMLKQQKQESNKRQSISEPMDLDLSQDPGSFFSSQNSKSWLKNENLDLIAKTVEDFRLQRLSMVQSLRQYVLCYETVLEWLVRQ